MGPTSRDEARVEHDSAGWFRATRAAEGATVAAEGATMAAEGATMAAEE